MPRSQEPPFSGELTFVVEGPPVSQQSRRSEKDTFAKSIRAQMCECGYLISGDVRIYIEWTLHEQDRYESDAAPDVDNILKPLLDALCGPEGMLIDDCQVQAVDCRWLDWTERGQQVEIKIEFFRDEWVSKEALCFVHFGKGLCFPINRKRPAAAMLMLIDQICGMCSYRDEMLESGYDYYAAKREMPIQRVFHRSRATKFQVVELGALRAALEAEMAAEPPSPETEALRRERLELRERRARLKRGPNPNT
jgi:Holliday junction resolvase RusA-like endonuclease